MMQIFNRNNTIIDYAGILSALIIIFLILIICIDVFARYVLNWSSAALYELEWHLFSMSFLLGLSYAFKHDAHVRVDLLYQKLSKKWQIIIDLLGTCLYTIPYALVVIYNGYFFSKNAYNWHEGSYDPGGLPFRFIVKGMIVIGFVLLLFQAFVNLRENFKKVFTNNYN